MSAMSLCRAPDVFRCAVAGAPVTSWDGYDTHYTGTKSILFPFLRSSYRSTLQCLCCCCAERYMGRPQVNVAGYTNSSVMSHVKNMTGRCVRAGACWRWGLGNGR